MTSGIVAGAAAGVTTGGATGGGATGETAVVVATGAAVVVVTSALVVVGAAVVDVGLVSALSPEHAVKAVAANAATIMVRVTVLEVRKRRERLVRTRYSLV
ncbi:hypothetical protein [Rhodococcus sp. ARC_M6]|uniref:hypothetical protein n=1 Tax=Rhodococcus sp. ARC_M6 TaxID=2928852 RepID=UPI001FB4C88A|nr:hypothetical protein [Rhodococcus sp. ARC_M6]MCJ0905826.1 hypothetical protein [Rhodococcus sp. ARC_M6]